MAQHHKAMCNTAAVQGIPEAIRKAMLATEDLEQENHPSGTFQPNSRGLLGRGTQYHGTEVQGGKARDESEPHDGKLHSQGGEEGQGNARIAPKRLPSHHYPGE
eukprot:TRINITY_DN31269_c0_g1_i1.p2 TRINITY_DN31269_c0_g1~~TRINITY_DN31269_c0_g1_i1.p2  ORF type:complete len:104 (-),score=17.99 TRINITY_DN31269_c0_g1_i1:70-381(-)